MTIFYSDVEPLSKYSPVMLHLTPLLEFFTKTLLGKISEAYWRGVNGLHVQVQVNLTIFNAFMTSFPLNNHFINVRE